MQLNLCNFIKEPWFIYSKILINLNIMYEYFIPKQRPEVAVAASGLVATNLALTLRIIDCKNNVVNR